MTTIMTIIFIAVALSLFIWGAIMAKARDDWHEMSCKWRSTAERAHNTLKRHADAFDEINRRLKERTEDSHRGYKVSDNQLKLF